MEDKIKCPFCGEEILKAAKKCRHCNEWLDQSANPHFHVVKESNIDNKSSKKSYVKYILFGVLALLIGGIGLFFVLRPEKPDSSEAPGYGLSAPNTTTGNERSVVEKEQLANNHEESTPQNIDLSFGLFQDLISQTPESVVKYLKSKGCKVEQEGTGFYTAEVMGGTIGIYFPSYNSPRAGLGPVEFYTSEWSWYRVLVTGLENAGYEEENGIWIGGGGSPHYPTFGTIDYSDVDMEGEDYAGGYTLYLKSYPIRYKSNTGTYED